MMDWPTAGRPVFASKDFTRCARRKLGYMAGAAAEFEKRNTKIIGLSVDPVTSHSKWAVDIERDAGPQVTFR